MKVAVSIRSASSATGQIVSKGAETGGVIRVMRSPANLGSVLFG